VAYLNREAWISFTSSSYLMHDEQRRKEGQEVLGWFAEQNGPFPQTPHQQRLLHYINLENLLVGSGVELAVKARLLDRGFVAHRLSTNGASARLAKEQKQRPIRIAEVLELRGFRYFAEGMYGINRVAGLSGTSLSFSTLLDVDTYWGPWI
jgi:hypothetical protein